MSSKDMLGIAVRKLVALPVNAIGIACDLLEKLQDPEWAEATKRFLRKEEPWPVALFSRDMTKEGWTLLEDAGDQHLSSPDKLELVPFLRDGESYVGGEEMAARAVNLNANLGQRQAEYFLEHQDEIPEEFRKFYLIFPGTKWRDRVGRRFVPYLYWSGGRWILYFLWLDYYFLSRYRLLRSRE